MKRKLALILAVLLMAHIFAGCTNSSEPDESATPSAAISSTPYTSKQPDTTEVTYPLVDEPVTFSAFYRFDTTAFTLKDYSENLFWKEMMKKTGVNIEFHHATTGSESEAFQLMISSLDYDDIINGFSQFYTRGVDDGIDQGIIRSLNDYTDYTPNMNAILSSSKDMQIQSLSDNGRLWEFYCILSEEQGPWGGSIVRQDLLEKYNINTPVTFGDWEVMLTTFLNNEPEMASGPLGLSPMGFSFLYSIFAGYNTGGIYSEQSFINKDGTVVFSAFEPGFKEYLIMMNDWYSKGLVKQDFYTGSFFADTESVVNNKIGVFEGTYDLSAFSAYFPEDSTMRLAPLPYPVKNVGDKIHLRQSQQMIRSSLGDAISTSVTDDEMPIICRFYDYMFSEEGRVLANWGVEGVTFEYDSNGVPQYLELISHNPDGLSFLGANAAFLGGRNMGGIYEWTRELNESSLECVNVWSLADDDWNYPENATMTSQEGTDFSTIMGDVQTLMMESCIGFIIGSKSFDEWDIFISQIEEMDIERCVEIKQSALNRYLDRARYIEG